MARKNGPLPDGHPLKGGLILFGSGIPEAWKEGFRKNKMQEQARIGAEIPERVPGNSPDASVPIPEASADVPDVNYPDDLQIQAFNDFEAAMLALYKKHVGTPDQ